MKHKKYYLQIYQYIFTNPEVFPEKLPVIVVLKSYDYHHFVSHLVVMFLRKPYEKVSKLTIKRIKKYIKNKC